MAGDYFGELGVLNGAPKPMSAWAITNTHLIYIEKSTIDSIKHLYAKRVESDKINFLKTVAAFKNLTFSKLKIVIDQFKPLTKIRGSYLFKEGDLVQNVYLV